MQLPNVREIARINFQKVVCLCLRTMDYGTMEQHVVEGIACKDVSIIVEVVDVCVQQLHSYRTEFSMPFQRFLTSKSILTEEEDDSKSRKRKEYVEDEDQNCSLQKSRRRNQRGRATEPQRDEMKFIRPQSDRKICVTVLKFLVDRISNNALHGQVTIGTLIFQSAELPLVGNIATNFEAEAVFDQEFIKIGETIDVTSYLCAYKVQLSEQMMSDVLFKKLGDYEIAWVDAEVGKMDSGMLSVLPASKPPPPHKSVFVGDLKFADFKQFLASKGIQSDARALRTILSLT